MDEAVHLEAPLQNPKCPEVDVNKNQRMMRGDKLWLHAEIRRLKNHINFKAIPRPAYCELASMRDYLTDSGWCVGRYLGHFHIVMSRFRCWVTIHLVFCLCVLVFLVNISFRFFDLIMLGAFGWLLWSPWILYLAE